MVNKKNITLKDLKIGTFLLVASFLIQPISMIFSQNYLAPKLLQPSQENVDPGIGAEISTSNLHIRGNENAKIFMVEYSDYQCPFCQGFHDTAKQVFNSGNGEIAWVYKHFPLSFHPEALPTAISSECVAKLGGNDKFWQYTDLMFANQTSLSESFRTNAAKNLGINITDYNTCIKDVAIKNKVEADQNEGSRLGVQGTPNTFVAKKIGDNLVFIANINGAQPKTAVDAIISDSLNKDVNNLKKDNSFWGKIKNLFK
jgi:protein-disulfide isomerase